MAGGRGRRDASEEKSRSRGARGGSDKEPEKDNMADHNINSDSEIGEDITLKDVMNSINGMETRLNSRMDKIETNISEQVKKLVKEEIDNFKQSVDNEMQILRDQITELQNKATVASVSPGSSEPEGSLSIVLRHLPEEAGEDITQRVNSLIQDGVKLQQLQVDSAERKKSYRDNVPGVVIAKCKSTTDKNNIMKHKSALKHSDQYHGVMVHQYKTPRELQLEYNLKTIVKAIGQDKLEIRGNRVIEAGSDSRSADRNQSADRGHAAGQNHWGGNRGRGSQNSRSHGRGRGGQGQRGRPH